MITTIKPQIECVEQTETYGRFVAEPLEPGFGVTLGNSLRRVLLGSLPGAAVTWVRIEGVQHEYSTLSFLKEDIIEFLLNVKNIRLRPKSERPATLRIEIQGEGVVTASDIQPSPDYEIVNPELYLATLNSNQDAKFSVELQVERGKGYEPASHKDGLPIGTLPVDAIFSPISKVNFSVERTRVEQRTDYDKLVLEVWTDGSVSPTEAMRQAAQILVDQFFLFCAIGKTIEAGPEKQPLAHTIPAEQYNMPIEKLSLSARTLNCLKRSNINKVGEVMEKTREELLTIRNFGEKSLRELYQILHSMGLLSEMPEDLAKPLEEEDEDKEPKAGVKKSLADLAALKDQLAAKGD
ncbi:MAG: DNA-directed RNA polymerase subunit alpha [Chloroflexi bacterium]|nr:DNA-directed RNA polymerase subunit alpha [Chloroflexota bacterium]